MTFNVRETGALLAAAAAVIGVWLGSGGVAHAAPQCADHNMSPAQCELYTSCLNVYANSDFPVPGDSLEDPGGCRRSAYLHAPPS
jgi:hypothetical protein